ncbi:NAD(+) diphosphatase [Actinomycetospora chlora]|uniref:NAD(+) diphosphatase n=1 Tax=Actinomycetospora chlora TaxID=663608 RepID=A0ABP9BK32_9PSEU
MSSSTAGPDLRAAFHLDADPSLSRSTVDRREQLRVDPDHAKALWPDARLVLVDPHGRTPTERAADGTLTLALVPTDGMGDIPEGAVVLGEEDGTAFWAVRAPDPAEAESNDAGSGFMTAEQWSRAGGGPDHENWTDLRSSGADLDARSAGLLTTAVSLLNWHDRSRFCARDGSEMYAIKSGWAQLCRAHGHEEYPRTDASMICLVHDGTTGDQAQVLLARQPIWPAGRYSVLAGFVEAGESLEACVARECAEEVGVDVHTISYLGSQPWPFPRSLMIGFAAVADPAQPLKLQEGEIEGARWVTRAELQTALDAGAWSHRDGAPTGARGVGGTAFEAGAGRELILPGGVSIARAMLEAWAAAG